MTRRYRFPALLMILILLSFLNIGMPGNHACARTFIVNTTGDEVDVTLLDDECDHDATALGSQCTLRAAIMQANRLNDEDTIQFDIPGTGPHTIQPDSPLPDILQPVIIDGYSQPVSSPNTLSSGSDAVLMIELDGSNAGAPANGLIIKAGDCKVKGLVINRFRESGSGVCEGHGIVLDVKGNNVIEGCFIGTNVAGTSALPNQGSGVGIFDRSLAGTCTNNTIGGITNEARNLIAGNSSCGIQISIDSGGSNLVAGNLIGVDKDGSTALGNGANGIFIDAPDNTIGGQDAIRRNVISGNFLPGIYMEENGTGNVVEGNYIGTDVSGSSGLENQAGITISESSDNTIGGTTASQRNIISGNDLQGIEILGSGARNNKVTGNYIGIGTDGAGTAFALPNDNGIWIENGTDNTIGGPTSGERNVISGNQESGIMIKDTSTTGNTVLGNYIGTDTSGDAAMANGEFGIRIDGAPDNTIGGTAGGAGNVISGNGDSGIIISEATASGNQILGNYIGTDSTGASAVANGKCGVHVFEAPDNLIGGTTSEASNLISGNATEGVAISGSTATGNQVQGNYIGTDATCQSALPNQDGVAIVNASSNTVGGDTAAAGNVISGNTQYGVWIHESTGSASLNNVQANIIGTDSAVTLTGLGNGLSGVFLDNAPSNVVGGLTLATGNWISGNGESGVHIQGTSASLNQVQGNYIGTNATGDAALGNTYFGVRVVNAPQNTIGGTTPEARNVISGNKESGIQIYLSGATLNQVQGNFIGTNAAGDSALANERNGIHVLEAPDNTIGGTATGAGNVISGNDDFGIGIAGLSATGNQIRGNTIGLAASGSAALPNDTGVALVNTTGNTVGGTDPETGNVIAGNTLSGVVIQGGTTTLNVVLGNYIGTDPTGTWTGLGNGENGVFINGAPQNTIGGTTTGARNVISGNKQSGISISQTGATLNQVLGNYIGTNADGNAALGNTYFGIRIENAPQNTIGGTTTGTRNVISGNTESGVQIYQSGSTLNQVQGNYIGTNAAGDAAVANNRCGIHILEAPGNTVGGTSTGARNVISGNDDEGVGIAGASATGNQIQGNFIGLDRTGQNKLANDRGVAIYNASTTVIGGTTAGAGNAISGNTRNGVRIDGTAAYSNKVEGNVIGTTLSGNTSGLGNGESGVNITGGAHDNTVGGTAVGASNILSGNTEHGVAIETGSWSNKVKGNLIGTDINGLVGGLGNGKSGVYINGAPNNAIGGTTVEARNLISGNNENGVQLYGTGASANKVQGNYIGTIVTGGSALPNGLHGISLNGAPNNTIGGAAIGAGNLISGNAFSGIAVVGSGSQDNDILGNLIGTQSDGVSALGNWANGVTVESATDNTIGGSSSGEGNTIAFNTQDGVTVVSGTGNAIASNAIFSNTGIGIDLGNNGVTANDSGDTDSGPNNYQNFPVLDAATSGSWGTRVLGNLDSQPLTPFSLQFFSNAACDGSNYGEGKALIHSATQTAGSVDVTLAGTIAQGQYITATATDGQGNTSEFCPCIRVVTDSDQDGVPDAVEANGPNGGDGNNDGTQDSVQPHVASVENSADGQYVTLATASGFQLINVQAVENPSPGDTPSGATFPIGFLKFTVVTLPLTGASFSVDLFLPPSGTVNEYYKHGPTLGNTSPHWYAFSYDSMTGAQFSTNKVTLYFTDGQRGDSDLISNGRVVDPGGPAFCNSPPVAVDDSYLMFENALLNITAPGVLANDTDTEDDPLTAVLESDVSDGELSLSSDGAFVYEPDEDFIGEDIFSYKAFDGNTLSNEATVTITVRSSGPTTILVPDHFQTIQEAVDFAMDGDTVLVDDGTYTGVGNKNIDFKRKAITVRSENGPANCIIDCERDGRGFTFHSGEGADSVLSGFTIMNGNVPNAPGGAIYCNASSPTISNNIIVGNEALGGGGINCEYTASPRILNNIIKANKTRENRYRYGGGIRCAFNASPLICNNIITGNFAYYGGGLYCYESSPTLLNNTFAYNTATTLYQQDCGASIQCSYSSPTITNCILWGDYLGTATHQLFILDGSPTVTYCNIDQVGYGDGTGAPDSNGNMRLDPLFVLDGYWDDKGTPWPEDDVWMDGDYHLQTDSPCVDAGTNAPAELPDYDFEDDPRVFDGDGNSVDTVDMGADEYVVSTCDCNHDGDHDVDGSDLAALADGSGTCDLSVFVGQFGKTDCP